MTRHSHSAQVRQIAVALNVDPNHLVDFAEYHPEPTVETVLNLAERPPVDQETRDQIAEWLNEGDQNDHAEAPDDVGGDPRGLMFRNGGEFEE